MGIIRIFLALIVLLYHCPQGIIPRFLHPALAVQCFYCISGFYIQLLIKEFQKNQTHWRLNFYKSRIIRLYPTYAIYMLGILIFFPTTIRIDPPTLSTSNYFLFITDNLFIFTQSIMIFFHKYFTIIPVSWSLSLELMFYFLASFILTKRTNLIISIVIASILCRITLSQLGYFNSGWQYAFFPNEISIFLCGSLSYTFYEKYLKDNNKAFIRIIGGFLILFLIYFDVKGWEYISGGSWDNKNSCGVPLRWWMVLILTCISIPFIFKFSKYSKIDRYIGELSYPIYLGHFFAIFMIKDYFPEQYQSITVIMITLILSLIIMHTVEIPLFKLRQSYKNKKKIESHSVLAITDTNASPLLSEG